MSVRVEEHDVRFEYRDEDVCVSALLQLPDDPIGLYVLAHGAGAGMRHTFMATIATELAARGIASLRYQFPYMEAGRKAPDSPARAVATVRAAVETAATLLPGVTVVAGGKSFGGRMTSTAASGGGLPGASGLVFLGFPLHAPNKPSDKRAAHLAGVGVPMLFLQGTRDSLADLALLGPIVGELGAKATMHLVDGGDHSFKVTKRSGLSQSEVIGGLADVIAEWVRRL